MAASKTGMSECADALQAENPYRILLAEASVADHFTDPETFARNIERSQTRAKAFVQKLDDAALRQVIQSVIDCYNRNRGYLPGTTAEMSILSVADLEFYEHPLRVSVAIWANLMVPVQLSKELLRMGYTHIITPEEATEFIAQESAFAEWIFRHRP